MLHLLPHYKLDTSDIQSQRKLSPTISIKKGFFH
jgi:hypothetical protein